MKFFLALAIVVNTIILGSIGYYNFQTYKITEKNIGGINRSIDTMNAHLKSINASLNDKLFGIMANLPKR